MIEANFLPLLNTMSEEITQSTAVSTGDNVPVSIETQEQHPQQTNDLDMDVEENAADSSATTEGAHETVNDHAVSSANENTDVQPKDNSNRKITYYRSRSLRTGLGKRLGFNSVQEMQQLREPEEPYGDYDRSNHGPYSGQYERRAPRFHGTASSYSPGPSPSGGRRLIDILDNGRYKSKNYRRSKGTSNGSGFDHDRGHDHHHHQNVNKGRHPRGKKQRSKVETPKRSIEDLDKELEEYMKGT